MSDRSESSFEVNGSAGPFGSSEGDGRSSGLYAATAAAVTAPAATSIVAGGTSGIIPDLAAISPFGDNAILGLFGPIADEPASPGPGGATELTADIFAAGTSGSFTYTDEPASNFHTCACCAGFHLTTERQEGVATSTDGAPGANGTLTQLADYLRVGYWASPTGGSNIAHSWGFGATVSFNVQDLTAAERALAREAFSLWDDFANVNFTEVNSGGNIVLLNNGSGIASASTSWNGSGVMTAATITISSNWNGGSTAFYSYNYQTYIHEIGHALGLGHQGPYNNTANWATQRSYDNDSWRYSVMSYFDQSESSQGSYRFVTGPQMADISAMQTMYGARSARTGDTVYGYNSNAGLSYNFSATPGGLGNVSSFTIYDSGGTDTIDGSGYNSAQTFDLRTGLGVGSSVGGYNNNIMIWGSSVVENATGGGGADRFIGNTANNVMNGGGGTDEYVFGANRAVFSFVEGNQTYSVTGGAFGTDTLNSIERFIFDDITVVDDNRGGISATGSIAVGGLIGGNTQFSGDRDWFSVQLQAGKRYIIEDRGSISGNGTLSDPLVRLHNSAGTQLASNDDSGFGLNSELAISVSTTGTYFLNAGAFGSNLGTYNLSIKEGAPGTSRYQMPELSYSGFGASGTSGGWSSNDLYPRMVKDVNSDTAADIIAFGSDGVYAAFSNSRGFADPVKVFNGFGSGASAGGWANNDQYMRTMANVDGANGLDIVGFGGSGVFIARNNGNGTFANATLASSSFGTAGGWTSDDVYHRELADVNADGRADIVGFGSADVFVALGQADGTFGTVTVALANGFSAVSGWSSDNLYPRRMADVNGDGRADIVGFGGDGVFVSLAQATPAPTFGAAFLALSSFGANAAGGSWTTDDDYPRMLADINNDGRADIVGFGGLGTFFALGQAGGTFGPVTADIIGYGKLPAGGSWANNTLYPRMLGDITGNGVQDIVAFGDAGVFSSHGFNAFVNV